MTWNPFRTPLDYIETNKARSPGIAVVSGVDQKYKWNEIVALGYAKARAVFYGTQVIHFQVQLTLKNQLEFDQWSKWRLSFATPPQGRLAKYIAFAHPWTQLFGITSVGLEEERMPERIETGGWTQTLLFLEAAKMTVAYAKPVATKPEVETPIERELRLNGERIKKLAKEQGLDVGTE